MSLKPGKFWPVMGIELGVGVVGSVLAVLWGKASGRDMDRDTVLFLCKMFGGISIAFMIITLIVAYT
jgi:hypothetical protein